MADGDGAAVGVEALVVALQAELLAAAEHLGGEGFVDFDHVHVGQGEAGAFQDFIAGVHRAQAHDAGRYAGDAAGDDARAGGDAGFFAGGAGADDQRAGAVVNAGGVTGGDHAAFNDGGQLGELIDAGTGARVLVFADRQRRLLAALGHLHRQDFLFEETVHAGVFVAALGLGRVGVRLLAADAQIGGHVLGGFRHGVAAELLEDLGVGEARADGGIEHRHAAAVGAFRLGHHERGAAHGFDAAGDHQLAFIDGDHARRVQGGGQAGTAQAVDGEAGHGFRQPGQQRRVAGHVAGVFAGLVGVAGDHVLDQGGVEGVTGDQGADDVGEQVVRTDRRKGAGVATEGGAQTVVDVGVEHE